MHEYAGSMGMSDSFHRHGDIEEPEEITILEVHVVDDEKEKEEIKIAAEAEVKALEELIATMDDKTEKRDEDAPTVAKLFKGLDSKYLRTKYESVGDIIEEIQSVKDTTESDPAKFFERFKLLSKKTEDEKIK